MMFFSLIVFSYIPLHNYGEYERILSLYDTSLACFICKHWYVKMLMKT